MSIPLILVYALLRLPFRAKDLRDGHAGGHAKLIRVNVAVTIEKPQFKRCYGSEQTISGQKQGDHLEVKMRENLLNREKQASFIVRVSSDDQVLPTRNDPLRARRITRSFGRSAALSSHIFTPVVW
tara:strand:+ start:422 stop:799 length:378 start_codon:yes stop_codon:yes gene_type:complete